MKPKLFLASLTLVAGLLAVSGCNNEDAVYSIKLSAINSPQVLGEDGTATLRFQAIVSDVKDYNQIKVKVSFQAANGSVKPASAVTDGTGIVSCVFTASDVASFIGGTVTASVIELTDSGVEVKDVDRGKNAVAEILPPGSEIPVKEDVIKKAEALKENTYSIQKGNDKAQVFDFPPEYSDWYVGSSYMDGTKQAIHVELMDEDPEQMTMGWLSGEIPPEVAGKLTAITQEFYDKYPWAAVKLGTMRLGQDKMLDCHMGQGGNVKLDGSSQIWLKEKSGSKAYSGQYQFLFVFVFENWTWDQETESYLPGEEYTMCGNAIVEELKADLSNFMLDYSSSWVAPGQSITLTAHWTPGASFDWSKVTLASQTRGGRSGDWFSWDASTQQLYAKQSADNDLVTLSFSYAGTDLTDQISLYNGPGYTSFVVAPKNGEPGLLVAENNPQGWSSNDYVYLSVNEFTSSDNYYSFNYHSIELDPSSDYYNKLYYNDYGPYVEFNHTIPEGDFNMIFRSRADHSVKCTVPVKMVKHKVQSFQITYPHSNGAYEPWVSGGENGVCNYPMGLSLGVITVPEDAYWNWAQVELEPGYDRNFSFSGYGGRDDHPKLMLISSTGSTHYGSQVIFRLKYDHEKRSEIYVDHN